MNETVIKRSCIFSLILGACIGILSLIPSVIGFGIFVLMFLSAPIVIMYMKKNEKHLSFVNHEQAAMLGGIIGFCSTVGFFASFSPLVCVLKFIFKNYYAYMIPDLISGPLWLFFVLIIMIAAIFAAINATSAMSASWVYSRYEKKPDDDRLDISVED